jgi:hypothetical protein
LDRSTLTGHLHMSRPLLHDPELEYSPTVANCRMNREREIRGGNSYAADFGFEVIVCSSNGSSNSFSARSQCELTHKL